MFLNFVQSLETLDNGKPYMNAFGEMMFSANMLKYYAGSADKVGGKTIPVGKWRCLQYIL